MAAVVPTLFIPGGKSLTSEELKQVCQLLNIQDPVKSKLPTDGTSTYFLLLSSNGHIPAAADPSKPLLKVAG